MDIKYIKISNAWIRKWTWPSRSSSLLSSIGLSKRTDAQARVENEHKNVELWAMNKKIGLIGGVKIRAGRQVNIAQSRK